MVSVCVGRGLMEAHHLKALAQKPAGHFPGPVPVMVLEATSPGGLLHVTQDRACVPTPGAGGVAPVNLHMGAMCVCVYTHTAPVWCGRACLLWTLR